LFREALVEAIDAEGVFGHAEGQEFVVGALQFAGDEALMAGGFAEEVDAGLGDCGEFDIEPVGDFGAGDAFEK
jgi:hypothetical protein